MIKEVSKVEYKELLSSFSDYHLVQSAEWDSYQYLNYKNQIRIAFYSNNILKAIGRGVVTRILRGKKAIQFNYGPIIKEDISKEDFMVFLKELKEFFGNKDNVLISISPSSLNSNVNRKYQELIGSLQDSFLHFRKLNSTILLNLTSDYESNYRKDIRYKLRRFYQSNSSNLKITYLDSVQDIKEYLIYEKKYRESKGFSGISDEVYEKMAENKEGGVIKLTLNDEILSIAYIFKLKSQNTLIILSSINTDKGFSFNSPAVLRSELHKWAKTNGFNTVDYFDGGSTKGIREFKLGFSNNLIEYPNEKLIVLDSMYFYIFKIKHLIFK